jgi:hypothetical protein
MRPAHSILPRLAGLHEERPEDVFQQTQATVSLSVPDVQRAVRHTFRHKLGTRKRRIGVAMPDVDRGRDRFQRKAPRTRKEELQLVHVTRSPVAKRFFVGGQQPVTHLRFLQGRAIRLCDGREDLVIKAVWISPDFRGKVRSVVLRVGTRWDTLRYAEGILRREAV